MGSVASGVLNVIAQTKKYDPTPDPTTGLTQKDRELITSTWALVTEKQTLKKNAVELIILLFQDYPYLQDHFELFKGKPLAELRTNPKMRAHATSVFYAVTSYVENLDDPETLVALVQKVAVSHIKKGITREDFENLKIVFLKFVKSLLGTQCTPEIESAWEKLLSAQNAVYKMTQDELASSK